MNRPQGASIQRCKRAPIEICPVYSVALFVHFSPAPWEAGLSFILPYITLLNPPPKQQKTHNVKQQLLINPSLPLTMTRITILYQHIPPCHSVAADT